MSVSFFEKPILNSPYDYPGRHWVLDTDGQPTSEVAESRRRSELITPVPRPKKQKKGKGSQAELGLGTRDGISTPEQEYNPTPIINEIRRHVDDWRKLNNPADWQVTPETARLLQHWRSHTLQGKAVSCHGESMPPRTKRRMDA